MKPNAKPQCTKRVYHKWNFSGASCSKPGKVERDGKWYCSRHDPVKQQEKEKLRDLAYKARMAEAEKQREYARVGKQLELYNPALYARLRSS